MLWNFDTTLRSNKGIFLFIKNKLFGGGGKHHKNSNVKTIINIPQAGRVLPFGIFNDSDCKFNFHRFRCNLIASCDISLELSCVVYHSLHFAFIVYFLIVFNFGFSTVCLIFKCYWAVSIDFHWNSNYIVKLTFSEWFARAKLKYFISHWVAIELCRLICIWTEIFR